MLDFRCGLGGYNVCFSRIKLGFESRRWNQYLFFADKGDNAAKLKKKGKTFLSFFFRVWQIPDNFARHHFLKVIPLLFSNYRVVQRWNPLLLFKYGALQLTESVIKFRNLTIFYFFGARHNIHEFQQKNRIPLPGLEPESHT